MKISITSKGNTLDSKLDERFGRTAYFVVYDTETNSYNIMDNSSIAASGGAGISAAQEIINTGAQAVITGNVGPNAMDVLLAGDIKIFKGLPVSIKENIESFKRGQLEEIKTTVPQHFGLSGENK